MTQHRLTWPELMQHAPEVVSGLRTVSMAVDHAGLDAGLIELIKVRVSQINGCAYCLQFHVNKLRQLQMAQDKIDQLPAWQESSAYSDAEKAALNWAETLTGMMQGVDAGAWEELGEHFDDQQRVFITAAIGVINAWNRIAGGLNIPPPPVM